MQNALRVFAAPISQVQGDTTSLDTAVGNIVKNVILSLGIVAVVVVLVGGVMYMTSAGDAGKVKNAKNTILGGVIGMVICALSFAIVNFTITNIISGSSAPSYDGYTLIGGGYSSTSDCRSAAGSGYKFVSDGGYCYKKN